MNPYLQQLIEEASQLHRSNDLAGAEKAYQKVLSESPENAEIHHLLGLVNAQQNKFEQAIKYFKQAIKVDSHNEKYFTNLGEAYLRNRNFTQALESHQQSLKVKEDYHEGYFHVGNTLRLSGKYLEAIQYYEKAIALNPKYLEALFYLGDMFQEMGKEDQALNYFNSCLSIDPDHLEVNFKLGLLYEFFGEFDQSIEHYEKTINNTVGFKDSHYRLAQLFEDRGQIEKAKYIYSLLLESTVDDGLLNLKLSTIFPKIYTDNKHLKQFEKQVLKAVSTCDKIKLDPSKLHLMSFRSFTGLALNENEKLVAKQKLSALNQTSLPVIENREVSKKPHIGFVVTAGKEGAFIKAMGGLVNNLDNEQFQITVICSLPHGYRVLEPAIQNMKVGFLSLPKRFDYAAQTILNAKFDLLHYWEVGTDYLNYYLPHLRLAKVQCTSWGIPESTGISNVDYYLSSSFLETKESQECYSEQLVVFKKMPIYYNAFKIPEISIEQIDDQLLEECSLYVCTQELTKIHPDFDEILKGILMKDTQAQVVFIGDKHSSITSQIKSRFENSLGLLANRVCFLENMTEEKYWALLRKTDLVLDTPHSGLGVSDSFEILSNGIPIVTMPSKYPKGRIVNSIYRQMELISCVVDNNEEYIDLAVTLATNPAKKKLIQNQLKDKSSRLMKDSEAIAQMTDFFNKSLQK